MVEFEVTAPIYFRVVVERRSDPEVHTLVIPSVQRSKGTTIDVRFEQSDSVELARQFVKTLFGLLRAPPWTGLRFFESRNEKKKWLELVNRE